MLAAAAEITNPDEMHHDLTQRTRQKIQDKEKPVNFNLTM